MSDSMVGRKVAAIFVMGIAFTACVQRRFGEDPAAGTRVRQDTASTVNTPDSVDVPFTIIFGETGSADPSIKDGNQFLFAKDGSKRQFQFGPDFADDAYWPDWKKSLPDFRSAMDAFEHLTFKAAANDSGYKRAQTSADCNEYSRLLSGEDVVSSPASCVAETAATGRLDPKSNTSEYGKYLTLATKTAVERLPAPLPVSGALVTDIAGLLPPERPAQGLDAGVFVSAVADAATTLTANGDKETARPACLANARTLSWTDAAAHYYCALDYTKFRVCYSTELVRLRGPQPQQNGFRPFAPDWRVAEPAADAASLAKSRLGVRALHEAAWKACYSSGEAADWFQAKPGRKEAFQAFVWTLPGVADYQIEQEQAAINAYYEKSARIPRLRRPFDAIPAWNGNVPRYHRIVQVQAANAGR